VPLNDPLYVQYHDQEWGLPIHDDRLLFEFLVLEGFQAGLSWRTVLYKRENFRQSFDNFDAQKIARYDENKVLELLSNPGIIRNRSKILACLNNALSFLKIQSDFGSFDAYIWQFVGGRPIVNSWQILSELPAKTPHSDAMSKDLIQRGFKFVGSTICYAHMQATGMVNDHTIDCFRFPELTREKDV
jgi:DNA-3-methyladenine glycosylase I